MYYCFSRIKIGCFSTIFFICISIAFLILIFCDCKIVWLEDFLMTHCAHLQNGEKNIFVFGSSDFTLACSISGIIITRKSKSSSFFKFLISVGNLSISLLHKSSVFNFSSLPISLGSELKLLLLIFSQGF